MISSNLAKMALFVFVIGNIAVGQDTSQPVAPAEGETVHVLVGKSILINVQKPLTRVLSSNPTVVETMQDVFVFEKQGVSPDGRTLGTFTATGIRPKFAEKLKASGISLPANFFEQSVKLWN